MILNDINRKMEFYKVSRTLEKHHNIFYEIWRYGQVIFSKDITKTACVVFRGGDLLPLKFFFNPDFWDEMDDYSRAFVVSHECLHAILNHGKRTKNFPLNDSMIAEIINTAQDVAINHMLVNNFGFEREKIFEQERLCWTDTVFPDMEIDDDLAFETYYNFLMDENEEGIRLAQHIKAIAGGKLPRLVDDHSQMPDDDFDTIWGGISKEVDNSTIEDFNKKLAYGNGDGKLKVKPEEFKRPKPSKKWERVVKKWKRRGMTDMVEGEQWIKPSRKYMGLPEDFCLPNEEIIDDYNFGLGKINVLCFMDVSGSCVDYIPYFREAILSMSPKRFNLKTYLFSDDVVEVDLTKEISYNSCGTAFSPLEDTYNELVSKGKTPDIVFVITDGCGSFPDHFKAPEKWNWFIIEHDNWHRSGYYKSMIPETSAIYDLEKFFTQPVKTK